MSVKVTTENIVRETGPVISMPTKSGYHETFHNHLATEKSKVMPIIPIMLQHPPTAQQASS